MCMPLHKRKPILLHLLSACLDFHRQPWWVTRADAERLDSLKGAIGRGPHLERSNLKSPWRREDGASSFPEFTMAVITGLQGVGSTKQEKLTDCLATSLEQYIAILKTGMSRKIGT